MSDETTPPGARPVATTTEGGWFGISTVEDFFRKVSEDDERLAEDIADPGLAMKALSE